MTGEAIRSSVYVDTSCVRLSAFVQKAILNPARSVGAFSTPKSNTTFDPVVTVFIFLNVDGGGRIGNSTGFGVVVRIVSDSVVLACPSASF